MNKLAQYCAASFFYIFYIKYLRVVCKVKSTRYSAHSSPITCNNIDTYASC